MTLQTDLQAAIDVTEAAAAKLHAVVHGDANSTITVESGVVKTVAKAIADIDIILVAEIQDVTDAKDAAEAAQAAAETAQTGAETAQGAAETAQSATAGSPPAAPPAPRPPRPPRPVMPKPRRFRLVRAWCPPPPLR